MRLLAVKLSVISAIAVVAFTYTNCSKVDFEVADLESTAQALGFKDGALILINEGDEFTASVEVSLRLEHNDAEEMMISDRADCSGGVWEPMARRKAWKLSAENNNVIVYARFRRFFAETWIESACVSDSIIHDNIAPTVAIRRQPGALFNNANQAIELGVEDSGSGVGSVRCQSSWGTGCSLNVKNHVLGEGIHNIRVSAVDRAGNVSAEVSDSLTVDLSPPLVIFNSVPAVLTARTTAKFEFSATDSLSGVAGYECASDGGAFAACASGASRTYAEGAHNFRVRAKDKAGNVSAAIEHKWNVKLGAPTAEITSGPAVNSNSKSATFTFVGFDGGAALNQFKCKMDNGAYAPCNSGSSIYQNLAEGSHVFSVIAIASSAVDGVYPESPADSRGFTVDTLAPTITINGPSGRQSANSASFSFTATDNGSGVARIECSLDNVAGFTTCGNARTFANLANGGHTVYARSVDNAGNFSAVASRAFFVDLVKPVVSITKAPANEINVTTAAYEFTATDADGGSIASIECRMDSGAWEKCVSPQLYEELAKGDHRFELRATDGAGLVSDVKSHQFRVAISQPVVICDPFGSTTKVKAGVAAKLAYYDGPNASSEIRYVEDVWNKGTKVQDTVILFGNISVPTRSFEQGFDIGGGQKLKNSRGEALVEWFSLDYNAEIKLDDGDAEGTYQFAVLSDDGAILWLDKGAGFEEFVNNDGHASSRMRCGRELNMTRASRIPMRMKYFQGPRTRIAVNLLWRKRQAGQTDYGCGNAGDGFWFTASGQPTAQFNQMSAQGWKVMNVNNFQMTEVIPNVCKDK